MKPNTYILKFTKRIQVLCMCNIQWVLVDIVVFLLEGGQPQHIFTDVRLVFLTRRRKSSDTQLHLPILKSKQSATSVTSAFSNSPVTPINGESVFLLSAAGREAFTNPTYNIALPNSTALLPTPPEVRTPLLPLTEADSTVNAFC